MTEVESATGQHVDTVQADLAELRDVDRLADELIARYDALHVLVNNAGVGFGAPGAGREESADGIELRFAVNHLAAYRLATRLSPLLRSSAPARIVQVASAGQLALDREDPLTHTAYDGVTAYRRSKLAQVMATYDLAADLVGTASASPHSTRPPSWTPRWCASTAWSRSARCRRGSTRPGDWSRARTSRASAASTSTGSGKAARTRRPTTPRARAWVRELSASLIADAVG